MDYEFISDSGQLSEFCGYLSSAPFVAFDTEFVAEDSYQSDLCLIQVAAGDRLAVIDPLTIGDVTPFWQVLTDGQRQLVVHAGREEFLFCHRATGERPVGWFDTQIAAAFIGLEYPAAYGSLISKLLGESLAKHETRTDWRRRPLSQRQIEYALEDVIHLERLHARLQKRIEEMSRQEWLADELQVWQDDLEASQQRENWRRVSGINGLSSRSLAIVRELWRWRDAEAAQRNRPPRRVLRDDLIVELARRQTANLRQIRAVRGLTHRNVKNCIEAIAAAIQTALALPASECPQRPKRSHRPQLNLIGQILTTALGGICRDAQLAPAMVGTAQDVRDLVAYRFQIEKMPPPQLARGWRAEVVGNMLEKVMTGQLALAVNDPLSETPLRFVPVPPTDAAPSVTESSTKSEVGSHPESNP